MRYIHHGADDIREYIKNNRLWVVKRNCDGKPPLEVATPSAIDEMLEKSHPLWGLALPYFISVSKTIESDLVTLAGAVRSVEVAATSDVRFLLVAYQDDGIISVSGTTLPFQTSAKQAEWWRP
jgi:hypothetical protein